MCARHAVLALALTGAAFVADSAASSRIARAEDDSDPTSAWESQWRIARDATVSGHADLCLVWAKRCPQAVATARFRILRVDPDHEATRTALGFGAAKDEAGATVWSRSDAARETIRRLADSSDASAAEFAAVLRKADVVAGEKLAVLGRSAQGRADAGDGDAWSERARRARSVALVWDRENEAANRGLGHKRFGGRFCDAADIGVLRGREARLIAGEKEIVSAARAEPVPIADGSLLVAAGLSGVAVKTPRLSIESTFHATAALALASDADAAARLLRAESGLPAASADAIRAARIYVLMSAGEARMLLDTGAGRAAGDREGGIVMSGRIGPGAWFAVEETPADAAARTIEVLVRIAFGAPDAGASPVVETI